MLHLLMVKLLVLGLIMICIIACIGFVNYYNTESITSEEIIYQGPVPQGYNLEHFRKTGETIKEVEE